MKKTISAGGVIVKQMNKIINILLIRDRRYPDWVLPKGHVEKGETIKEAALREVAEEAGLSCIKIVKLLGKYERYVERAGEYKTIYYYLMMPTAPEEPKITKHNKKDEIEWFPLDNLPNFYLPEQQDLIEKNKEVIISVIKEVPAKK